MNVPLKVVGLKDPRQVNVSAATSRMDAMSPEELNEVKRSFEFEDSSQPVTELVDKKPFPEGRVLF